MLGRLSPVLALVVFSACGGDRTSPTGPTETPDDPPTYTADIPGLGELTVTFLEFHPPRGGQLVPGQGTYLVVEYSLPSANLIVEFFEFREVGETGFVCYNTFQYNILRA